MASKNNLASAIASIRAEIASRKTEIRELEAQREAIATATPAREDLFQAIDQRLAADAEKYRRELHKAFGVLAMQPLLLDSRLGPDCGTYPIDVLSLATGAHGRGTGEAASAPGMALLLGDVLKESIHRQLEGFLAGKVEGLPLKERRAEIARLDAEIAGKRGELAGLLEEAKSAGVVLAA